MTGSLSAAAEVGGAGRLVERLQLYVFVRPAGSGSEGKIDPRSVELTPKRRERRKRRVL